MDDTAGTIRVDCYASHRGEQAPRRFLLGKRLIDVTEIVDAWLAPDHRYFKVVGDDGLTYLLRHDIEAQRWELAGS